MATAFTLSHSVTLALAATGRLVPGGWWLEALIAFTIVVVAFESLQSRNPLVPETDLRFEWALCFGLIHGMAFGGAVTASGVPPSRILPALAGFNFGLEAAQIAFIAAALPLLVWLEGRPLRFQDQAVRFGSSVLVVFGSVWFLERMTGGFL